MTKDKHDVTVELLGAVRRPWPEQKRTVPVDPGTTVGALLGELGFNDTEQRHLSVTVGGHKVKRSATLADGDQLAVLLIVGGG